MVRALSRSVFVMFLFDLAVLSSVTAIWYEYFHLPKYLTPFIVLLTTITGISSLFLKGHYKIREFNITLRNMYLLFEGILFTNVPNIILLLIFSRTITALYFLIGNMITIYILLLLYRMCFHFYLFHLKKIKNILIIGTGKDAQLISNEIKNKFALRMNVVGFLEDINSDEDEIISNQEKIFSFNEDLNKIIKHHKIDIVIVTIKRRMEEALLTKMIFGIPQNVQIYKMPDFYEMVTGKLFIDKMTINWLFYDFMNNRSRLYDFCKRTFDIVSAVIILTVMAPVMIYICIRVKLTDGDSPIYTQIRVGRGGKPFKCYKLRTMYKNDYIPKDVRKGGYAQDQDHDNRVIPFCKFVRKARFDEIPQMINILKGEMSIVGPRAEWEDLVKLYSKEIDYYPCRQWVKTGWTGWAQINQGHCISNDDITEKLQYDLFYIKHRNILWEVGILIKAIFLALGGRHG